MAVRGKFKLTAIEQSSWAKGGAPCHTLKFRTIYDQSIPEDQRFAKATPTGQLDMQVDNPAALEQFELGADYYLDFTPAGE